MRRGLWFAGGAAVGVYAMVRGRRVVEAFTVDGLRDRAQALALGARLFREEVATGKAEKEVELRAQLATGTRTRALSAGPEGDSSSE